MHKIDNSSTIPICFKKVIFDASALYLKLHSAICEQTRNFNLM